MPISVIVDNRVVDCKLIKFSDGACNVQIDPGAIRNAENFISVTLKGETVDTIMAAATIAGSIIQRNLKFRNKVEVILNVPYLPYGRADREFEPGMVSCVDVFLSSVSFFFDTLVTVDAHSPVSLKNNQIKVCETSQSDAFISILSGNKNLDRIVKSDVLLCAPDKGARAKTEKLANRLEKEFVVCDKNRNPVTGWIESVTFSSETDIKGKDILIVDDICDGGATFVKTAEELKKLGSGKIYLYVTHGIFSKGLKPFESHIDGIFVYQLVGDYISDQHLIKFNQRG